MLFLGVCFYAKLRRFSLHVHCLHFLRNCHQTYLQMLPLPRVGLNYVQVVSISSSTINIFLTHHTCILLIIMIILTIIIIMANNIIFASLAWDPIVSGGVIKTATAQNLPLTQITQRKIMANLFS